MLVLGSSYREAGGDYFDKLNPERTVARLTKRLENIGYQVQVTPAAPASVVPAPAAPLAGPRRWKAMQMCGARCSLLPHRAAPKAGPA